MAKDDISLPLDKQTAGFYIEMFRQYAYMHNDKGVRDDADYLLALYERKWGPYV